MGASKKATAGQGFDQAYYQQGNIGLQVPFFVVGVFMQFVLEVAGAGGAWWGMSEVWKWRGAKTNDPSFTNDRIRYVSNTVFSLGMIRMLFRYAPDWGIAQALVDPHA